MATNTAGNFGAIAPAAIDPFQIENTLADIIGKNNIGNAQNLLSQYHQQQVASEGNYNYNLQQQHDFARQQLAEQMANNYRGQMLEAGRQAGGLPLLNAPGAGGPGGGMDPNLVQQIDTGLQRAQQAKTFSDVGSGLSSSTNAGFQPTDPQAQYLSGGMVGPRTDPVAIQAAKLKLQGDLARAAASGGHRKYMSIPYKGGFNERGDPLTSTIQVPQDATPEEIEGIRRQAELAYTIFHPTGTGVAGQTPPGGVPPTSAQTSSATRPPPSPPQGTATNLPTNPQPPAKPVQPATQGASNATAASQQTITDPRIQNLAKTALTTINDPVAKANIHANIVGGTVLPVVKLQGGGYGFTGRDGKTYAIPGLKG